MPSVKQNFARWNDDFQWEDGGDVWSRNWGGPDAQWYGTILPRIHHLFPTGRILEIAPGYGRWTNYLLANCSAYVGVDISTKCIAHCRSKFVSVGKKAQFHIGNGYDLSMVPDSSCSFIFSFDSLIHAEEDVMASYIHEIARVLTCGGSAFLHHSNVGEYLVDGKLTVANKGWRATSVSAELARDLATAAGLVPIANEKIKWTFDYFSDCFSLLYKLKEQESVSHGDSSVFRNETFDSEMKGAETTWQKYVRFYESFKG